MSFPTRRKGGEGGTRLVRMERHVFRVNSNANMAGKKTAYKNLPGKVCSERHLEIKFLGENCPMCGGGKP